MWLYHRVMSPKGTDEMANSVEPDQTAQGAVWSGSALFAQTCLSKNLWKLRYTFVILSASCQHIDYIMVKQHCSNFRIITAIFSGDQIFQISTVSNICNEQELHAHAICDRPTYRINSGSERSSIEQNRPWIKVFALYKGPLIVFV